MPEAEGAARGHKKMFMHSIPFMNPVHTSVYDGPSFIRQYFADSYLIFQKYTKNHHLYCHFPHLKVLVKSATCLECTIQNRGVRCACTYAWAHKQQMFMTHFEFFSITFSQILSYFSNKINRLKLSILRRYDLHLLKTIIPNSKNGTKYRQILIIGRAMNDIYAWSRVVF